MARDGQRAKCICKKSIKDHGIVIFKKGKIYEINKKPNWIKVYNDPDIGWDLSCNEQLFNRCFSIIYHGG